MHWERALQCGQGKSCLSPWSSYHGINITLGSHITLLLEAHAPLTSGVNYVTGNSGHCKGTQRSMWQFCWK